MMNHWLTVGAALVFVSGSLTMFQELVRHRVRVQIAGSFDFWPALMVIAAFLTGSFGLLLAGSATEPSLGAMFGAWGICLIAFIVPSMAAVWVKSWHHAKA